MFNHFGECGTGALAVWADRLWVITYAPHEPRGSDDKLYEIDDLLNRVARPESVGGTPADRMVHRESNQLVIGPYFIDAQRGVRVVPPAIMPGRLTAATRDLSDPANFVCIYDMEGALFRVNVHTLAVTRIVARAGPGAHGKGGYCAQGRLVLANNGNEVVNNVPPAATDPAGDSDTESAGALVQWDGAQWTVLARRQFTDVTGPGGIEGSPSQQSPLWALGWDKRSVLLMLLDRGEWHTFRLPIGDYSYVAPHGWYTEWPRIRDIGEPSLLMNMHGQWFDFPKTFSISNTAGIRPVADYLKITGDFCDWKRRLVFACDDASMMENPLLGQSQSNLWFTTRAELARCGTPSGAGSVWLDDSVKAGQHSDPYLFAGYSPRIMHLTNDGDQPLTLTLEQDSKGDGNWTKVTSVTLAGHEYAFRVLPNDLRAEWVRLVAGSDCPKVTASFIYGLGGGSSVDVSKFASLTDAGHSQPKHGGVLRPLAETGTLLYAPTDAPPVEVTADLKIHPYTQPLPPTPKGVSRSDPFSLSADASSLIFTQGDKRYRLPVASPPLITPAALRAQRSLREVVTERFLLNAGGSFFMVPDPSAGGTLRMKPVCSHGKYFCDFCSWRGITVLADETKPVWFGDIDDLWQMGKPTGTGGPWLNTDVKADQPADPYLMYGYDHKSLTFSHDQPRALTLTLETDFNADGSWHALKTFSVEPQQPLSWEFPAGYSSHWVRARIDHDARVSLQFKFD